MEGYQNDRLISLKIAETGQFALIIIWLYMAGFLEMLRLCNVSGMTCYIFFAVLHIVWLDGIQKDHLWT